MSEQMHDPRYTDEKRRRKVFEWRAEGQTKRLKDTRERADTDPLTGLLRRNIFERRLDDLISRFKRQRKGDEALECISLFIIDADNFKLVNDVHGHPIGDQVLKQIAAVIKKHVPRASDLAARLGGEEFAIAFQDVDGKALEKAEGIRADVESSVLLPNGKQVTVSIGIAETKGRRSAEVLYKRADEALYKAKENGRNQIVVAGNLSGKEEDDNLHVAA